jgi:hypothetical protein
MHNNSDNLYLAALESVTPEQLDALLAIAKETGVPLSELIDEAIDQWLTKEFREDV